MELACVLSKALVGQAQQPTVNQTSFFKNTFLLMVFGLNVPNAFELYKLGHGRRGLFSFLFHSFNELLFIVGSQNLRGFYFIFIYFLFLACPHSIQIRRVSGGGSSGGWLSVSFPVEEIN